MDEMIIPNQTDVLVWEYAGKFMCDTLLAIDWMFQLATEQNVLNCFYMASQRFLGSEGFKGQRCPQPWVLVGSSQISIRRRREAASSCRSCLPMGISDGVRTYLPRFHWNAGNNHVSEIDKGFY